MSLSRPAVASETARRASPLELNHGRRRRSLLLKACSFAAGLAGIVAEYAMSTLASYLLGHSMWQWALTISIMLFAMGLGSRLSKHIHHRLLEAFMVVELALSVLCAVSALLGGLLFAFVALPDWGLTYTPIAVGAVNFAVAAMLFWSNRKLRHFRRRLACAFAAVPVLLAGLALGAQPIVLFGEQAKYRDRIIYQEQTPYQKIVVTQWRDHF